MNVAVPREKHSPRFGQRASSQTVFSSFSRRSTRSARASGASGLPFLAHSGKRRSAESAEEADAEPAEDTEGPEGAGGPGVTWSLCVLCWPALGLLCVLCANSVLDYERFELFVVPKTPLDVLGVDAVRKRAHAHVEQALGGPGAHHVRGEPLALQARNHGVGARLVLERTDLNGERPCGRGDRLGRRAGFGRGGGGSGGRRRLLRRGRGGRGLRRARGACRGMKRRRRDAGSRLGRRRPGGPQG